MIDEKALLSFQTEVYDFYHMHGRHDLPWRIPEPDNSFDPYKILVSEIMLQQTQVNRVVSKFTDFIIRFPTLEDLASSTLGEVLHSWNGLGYNRRAKFLHETARIVIREHQGVLPDIATELIRLPGIGPNTAGAILAYAFNQPVVFIETNIRTVYIHHFFSQATSVSDQEIQAMVAATVLEADPRSWYWSLMDYGSYIKRTIGNPNAASKTYTKQSRFIGSKRQIRGQVILLLKDRTYSRAELKAAIGDARLMVVLQDLVQEGLISQSGQLFKL